MSKTLSEVVHSGALYCDEFYPGWAELFREEGPHIQFLDRCVLGKIGISCGLDAGGAFYDMHVLATTAVPVFAQESGNDPFVYITRYREDRTYSWDEYNGLWRQEVERRLKSLPEESAHTPELVTA